MVVPPGPEAVVLEPREITLELLELIGKERSRSQALEPTIDCDVVSLAVKALRDRAPVNAVVRLQEYSEPQGPLLECWRVTLEPHPHPVASGEQGAVAKAKRRHLQLDMLLRAIRSFLHFSPFHALDTRSRGWLRRHSRFHVTTAREQPLADGMCQS